MQPVSNHWADIAAIRIIKERGDKDTYTLASGITPSGNVHFGNFREVVTVDLVARALKKLGKEVRFIYSWDNFDTFRKVPANLPEPSAFEKYLRESIARIPDPWGQANSYSAGRCEVFEDELKNVGIYPEFIYQESHYGKGTYAKDMVFALENKEAIREILNKHRTRPLDENWLPTVVYCSQCKKDEMHSQTYEGDGKYSYHCKSCEHKETFTISESSNLKLIWRVDWPMRWAYEKVDFEPGGKDHSSEGGSFDTGKEIVKLWGQKAPSYLQYDFVMIKGGMGKMSSSKGELYTLSDLDKVYEPQIIRWIYVSQRPNHDFSISFDEDVFKIYEEFDRNELKYYDVREKDKLDKKELTAKRTHELSVLEEDLLGKPQIKRASFRMLCNRLQICSGDIEKAYKKFYKEEGHDESAFKARAQRAWYWVQNYADEDFRYNLREAPLEFSFSDEQKKAVELFRAYASKHDFEALEPKQINELLWAEVVNPCDCDSKEVFQALYQCLIAKDKGPRLPSFLKELGRERTLELLP